MEKVAQCKLKLLPWDEPATVGALLCHLLLWSDFCGAVGDESGYWLDVNCWTWTQRGYVARRWFENSSSDGERCCWIRITIYMPSQVEEKRPSCHSYGNIALRLLQFVYSSTLFREAHPVPLLFSFDYTYVRTTCWICGLALICTLMACLGASVMDEIEKFKISYYSILIGLVNPLYYPWSLMSPGFVWKQSKRIGGAKMKD